MTNFLFLLKYAGYKYINMSDQNEENPAKKEEEEEIEQVQLDKSSKTLQHQNTVNEQQPMIPIEIQRETSDKNFQEDIMAIYNNLMKGSTKAQDQQKNIKKKTPKKQLKKDVKQLKFQEKCQMAILKQFNDQQKETLQKIIKKYQMNISSFSISSGMNTYRVKRKFFFFKNVVYGVYQLLESKNTSLLLPHQISFLENAKKNIESFAELLAIKFDTAFLKICNQGDRNNASRRYQNQWDIFEKNFMDPQNSQLRKKIICGDFKPQDVATMAQDQMYSSNRKKKIAETKKRLLREFEKPQQQQNQKEEQVQIGYGFQQSTVTPQLKKNILKQQGSLVLTSKPINITEKVIELQSTVKNVKEKWKNSYAQLQQPVKQKLKKHFEKNVKN